MPLGILSNFHLPYRQKQLTGFLIVSFGTDAIPHVSCVVTRKTQNNVTNLIILTNCTFKTTQVFKRILFRFIRIQFETTAFALNWNCLSYAWYKRNASNDGIQIRDEYTKFYANLWHFCVDSDQVNLLIC